MEIFRPASPLNFQQFKDLEPGTCRKSIQTPECEARIVEGIFESIQVEPNTGMHMKNSTVFNEESKNEGPIYSTAMQKQKDASSKGFNQHISAILSPLTLQNISSIEYKDHELQFNWQRSLLQINAFRIIRDGRKLWNWAKF